MPRKEVKVGVAVVAVLILVLIAYMLVVPGGQTTPSQPAFDEAIVSHGTPPTLVQADSASPPPASNEPAAVRSEAPLASGSKNPDPFGPPDERWLLALNTGSIPQTRVSSDRAPGSVIRTDSADRNLGRDPSVGTNSPFALSPTTRPATRTHTVTPGESLARIAEAVYGSQVYYRQILAANPGINPEKLRPGTVIHLPDIAEVKSLGGADDDSPAPQVDPRTEYRVQPGDSLTRIAVKLYGKDSMWQKIYDLNAARIGSDPSKLKVGMVLQLPAPPTANQ